MRVLGLGRVLAQSGCLQGPGGRLHSQLRTSLWAPASFAGWRRGDSATCLTGQQTTGIQ